MPVFHPANRTKVSISAYLCYNSHSRTLSLRPIDVEAMKQIGKRTNLIPVIAKADTISKQTLAVFKERVTHN